MNLFVIPWPAELPQPIEALPETPPQFDCYDFVERSNNLMIAIASIYRPVIRRPRQPGCSASARHPQPVFVSQNPDRFALG